MLSLCSLLYFSVILGTCLQMRSKNRNKYVRVYLYIHAYIYRHEQNIGTAGEMRKITMKLSQTWTNRIKATSKENTVIKTMKKSKVEVPKNNERHETKQWIQQWTSKKICSEEMFRKNGWKWTNQNESPCLTHSCLTSYNKSWKSKLETFSVCIYFCVVGLHQLLYGRAMRWNPFLVDCPETALSLRRLDLLQRMIVLGVVWVWNHAAI